MDTIHISQEHRILREQVERFVEQEVIPNAQDWENAGSIPRNVLKLM